jgi:hypothetical protein
MFINKNVRFAGSRPFASIGADLDIVNFGNRVSRPANLSCERSAAAKMHGHVGKKLKVKSKK